MPPDVFLVLASSGITFLASLMFFVSKELPPAEFPDDPARHVAFCLPPSRASWVPAGTSSTGSGLAAMPPPLPERSCEVDLSTQTLNSSLNLRPSGDDWLITLSTAPISDSAAVQVHGGQGFGTVNDLRWHGKAGVAKPVSRQWRQKPAKA
jgi:hypothetical protein